VSSLRPPTPTNRALSKRDKAPRRRCQVLANLAVAIRTTMDIMSQWSDVDVVTVTGAESMSPWKEEP
jgi:hypothetical protein